MNLTAQKSRHRMGQAAYYKKTIKAQKQIGLAFLPKNMEATPYRQQTTKKAYAKYVQPVKNIRAMRYFTFVSLPNVLRKRLYLRVNIRKKLAK